MQRREFLQALAGAVAVSPALMIRAAAAQQTEAATESAAFKRFRASFFEDPDSPRNGLDEAALGDLTGEERVRAEDMLLAYLPDSRAIIGLGVLRSKRAEPRLIPLFATERQLAAEHLRDELYNAYGLVYVAKALWRIHPDPRWLEAMVDVLATSGEWTSRQEAAIALYEIHDAAAEAPLVKALDDQEALVRYHAARALLALHGIPTDPMHPADMTIRVMSDDAARREDGKRKILAAIAGRPIAPP
jgi:hypothetical protein